MPAGDALVDYSYLVYKMSILSKYEELKEKLIEEIEHFRGVGMV